MQYASPPQPTLTFFPAVLKTLSNPYPSTRPLVYNYLLHHAEGDPDTALLSINTIQKTLSDTNPRVRAMALKTMSGIRVPVISQIVSLAIKKGVSDLSPLVRKAAALACVKCVRLDPTTRPQIESYLSTLLTDKQYYVAGAAVQAFMEICPEKLEFIHPVYRQLCKMVVDMDEWGQLSLIRLMTVYARKCFPRRVKRVKRTANEEDKAKGFYEDLEPTEETEAEFDEVQQVDSDLELFLKTIQSLLSSRNSAVIIAVTRAYLYLSPTNYLHHTIGPLIALLRSPQDMHQIVLYNIIQVCLIQPSSFISYFRHFLVRSTDAPYIWQLKLEILTLIFPRCKKEVQYLILAELEHFSKDHNAQLVRESVRAIGRCAQFSSASTSRRCLSLLLKQLHSPDANLVGEAMEVIRHLIQRAPDEHSNTVVRLAKNLDSLTSPMARASIVWLIGEFAGYEPENNIAADVLRILVKGYAEESNEVRTQIVLLAAKLYLHHLNAKNAKQKALDALNSSEAASEHTGAAPISTEDEDGFNSAFSEKEVPDTKATGTDDQHPIEMLYQHTMLLARYTPSYDLRDRARLFRALLAVQSSTELATLLLLAPKPVPQAPSPSESRKNFTLGSASLVIGEEAGANGLRGYEPIPDWAEEGREPDPKLRDHGDNKVSDYGASTKSGSAGQMLDNALSADSGNRTEAAGAKKSKTLDDWLDEEGEEGEEDEGSEDESEGSSETETEDESEEETESEDDERAGLVK